MLKNLELSHPLWEIGLRGMLKNYVLVDYENVQPLAESLDEVADEQFSVFVFVGNSQNRLSYDFVSAFQRLRGGGEYIKISGNGKNALDFHIACYLGVLAMKDPKAYFHVVSKDTGYDPLLEHLREKTIRVNRVATIEGIPVVKFRKEISKLTPKQKGEKFLARLRKGSRPASEKAMRSALRAFYQRQLSEEEVEEVLRFVKNSEFVSIADGKVAYAE